MQRLGASDLPRAVTLAVIRGELAAWRHRGEAVDVETVLRRVRELLAVRCRSRLQPVINGTGVLLHTNLGRAPLASEAVRRVAELAAGYSNLEFDLETGRRGGRAGYLEEGLATLCGAAAATLVNNCAAALVLILKHLIGGERREVVISRGELVQIGGGFRIPEILEVSGARLREVGTTNRTSLVDYRRALSRETALVLRVHRSNFYMGGFVESPERDELVALTRRRRVPLVEDLGSGAIVATERLGGVEHEPTPAEVLRSGVDLVCFSGDKLFGGAQAGVIAGRRRLIEGLKRDPFFRALRCDKLVVAAMQATVEAYLDSVGRGGEPGVPPGLPFAGMLGEAVEELERRATDLVASLSGLPVQASVGRARARVGGGTLPGASLESVTLDLVPEGLTAEGLGERLRRGAVPVIGTVSGGRYRLHLRTVFSGQEKALLEAIAVALSD